MRGTPVWLASVSRQSPITGRTLSTQLWSPETVRESTALLRRVLGPAGNPARERVFRMQITLCLQRALNEGELMALPDWFHVDPATDLAGGPVEILSETEDSGPSTRPCHAPGRRSLDPRDPMIWFPVDCQQCGPCLARRRLEGERDVARAP